FAALMKSGYAFEACRATEIPRQFREFRQVRCCVGSRVRIRGHPNIGQELAEPIHWMSWQPLQDVFQVRERIDVETLAAWHQAIQAGRPSTPSSIRPKRANLSPPPRPEKASPSRFMIELVRTR